MEGVVIIDPISKKKNEACFLSSPELLGFYHETPDIEQDRQVVCFDARKLFDHFDGFFWDVKTIYELMGFQFKSLIELHSQVFEKKDSEKYLAISNKVKSHIASYVACGIDPARFKTSHILPEDLLFDLYNERAVLVKQLFLNLSNEDKFFYKETFFNTMKILHKISKKPIKIDLGNVKDFDNYYFDSIKKNSHKGFANLEFKFVGASTGRLGFESGSLNLYALPKKMRDCVVASESCNIVQIDFKSFQPRLAIFSTDDEEFKIKFSNVVDVYGVLPGDREKNKIAFLAWMFGKKQGDEREGFEAQLSPIKDHRDDLYRKAKHDGYLVTKWGRRLFYRGEPRHVVYQHYITATEVDSVLHLLPQLYNALKETKSRLLFPFHDAIVLEVHNEDLSKVALLKRYIQDSLFGKFQALFPVEVSMGKTFGKMSVQDF